MALNSLSKTTLLMLTIDPQSGAPACLAVFDTDAGNGESGRSKAYELAQKFSEENPQFKFAAEVFVEGKYFGVIDFQAGVEQDGTDENHEKTAKMLALAAGIDPTTIGTAADRTAKLKAAGITKENYQDKTIEELSTALGFPMPGHIKEAIGGMTLNNALKA